MALQWLRNRTFSRTSLWFQILVVGGSTLLCLVATAVFWLQPDSCAAVLVLPRWLWMLPGLFLAALGCTRRSKLPALAGAVLWLIYGLVFVEETRPLTRWRRWPSTEWHAARTHGTAIRVVSLNCAGDEKAAAEAGGYQPDLVLLQESPVRPKLKEMAPNLVGADASAICGVDVSIIARGRLTPIPVPAPFNNHFAHARVRFASGSEAEVFVVRLPPYEIRIDLWSPQLWQRQTEVRRRQRQQIEWLAGQIQAVPQEVPLIVGGDFNLPASDRMLRGIRSRLTDTFLQSGSGWGNTIDNDIPFLLIDQVWCSGQFRADSVVARRTVHSDHRMVVSDLLCLRDR
jgi:endonuclease/exonuclease/phosphatase (EEP) superfamily protein YafD